MTHGTHTAPIQRDQNADFSLPQALLVLLLERKRHGYGLYEDFSTTLGTIWTVKRSRLYAALTKLHAEGLVTTSSEAGDQGPRRQVYHPTAAGRDAAHAWMAAPVMPPHRMRVELLAKFALCRRLGRDDWRRLIAAQRSLCRSHAGAQVDGEPRREPGDNGDPVVTLLTESYRRNFLQGMLVWLDECEELLAAGDPGVVRS